MTNTFYNVLSDIPGDMDNLTTMFADDTKLYAALTDDVNSPISLQEDPAKLQYWSITMEMKFHPDKCHVVHLGQSNPQNPNQSIELGQWRQAQARYGNLKKDPEITIDQQLKFSDHIENSVEKANRVLGCIATRVIVQSKGEATPRICILCLVPSPEKRPKPH